MQAAARHKKMKVLVIAEAANPLWTSVPLVGWSLAHALRSVAHVHLVTQLRNRSAIADQGYVEGRDFTIINSEPVVRPLWLLSRLLRGGRGKGWTTGIAFATVGYYYFELLTWCVFRKRIRAGEYDIVHRVTPLSPTMPSILAPRCRKAGVPFVIGPLNGGVPWPRWFDKARRQEKEWLSYIRAAYRLLPYYKSTLSCAAAIIVGSRDTQSQLPRRHQRKTIYMPENGVDPTRFPEVTPEPFACLPLKACFVGRLVPYKGVDMLVEAAIPFLRRKKLILDIVGDGPLFEVVQRTLRAQGVENQVNLHGWVPHERVHTLMSSSHVLAFPSIREFGGGVVLEAMALGIVPIVVDYAGPGDLVDDEVGIKVPIGPRQRIVREYGETFRKIVAGEIDLKGRSGNAVRRVAGQYTWRAKADQIAEIYEWVTHPDATIPVFFENSTTE